MEATEIRMNANTRLQRVQERISELERVENTTRERCRTLLREGLERIDAGEYRELPDAPAPARQGGNGAGAEAPSFLDALRALRQRRRAVRHRRP